MADSTTLLHGCLYFTANALARGVTRMAEASFRATGLSPSHAFLLLLVNERPGVAPSALAEELHLAPSTVTRFVDALAAKGLLERRARGRAVGVWPTPGGTQMRQAIAACWKDLHHAYSAILGRAEGEALTARIDAARQQLEAGGGEGEA